MAHITQVYFAPLGESVHNTRVFDEGDPAELRSASSDTILHRKGRTGCRRRRLVLAEHVNSDAAKKLAKLSEIASGRAHSVIERALVAAKEELGMEIAFFSEFADERMVFRKLIGDAESFGWREGEAIPLDDTFCRLLVEGHLPSVIPNAKDDERVRFLDVTGEARIGSYVGAPVRFSDGRLYGTLCALSHSSDPSLEERDAQFLRMLARLVAEQLKHDRSLVREATSRVRAHERRRIGRELHDRVSHLLGVVHQSLELHEALKERDPERAAERLKIARRSTKKAMEWTRDISQMLRVTESVERLEPLLQEAMSHHLPPEMKQSLIVRGDDSSVPSEKREQMYLALREAVRNVASHSGASEVRVAIDIDPEKIVGVVEDDGRGFTRGKAKESGGLAYMAERASLLGGTCSVGSRPGEGTRVEVSLPLEDGV